MKKKFECYRDVNMGKHIFKMEMKRVFNNFMERLRSGVFEMV